MVNNKFTELIKEAKTLLSTKENEVTWLKINTLFNSLRGLMISEDSVTEYFKDFSDLLTRSLQSDRSRLNGTCCEYLNHCSMLHKDKKAFLPYIPILTKNCGRTNRIVAGRSKESLIKISKHLNPKLVLKMLSVGVKSINKNIRIAVFETLEKLVLQDFKNQEIVRNTVETGLKDPAIEIRNITRRILEINVSGKVKEENVEKPKLEQIKSKSITKKLVNDKKENFRVSKIFKNAKFTKSNVSKDLKEYFKSYRNQEIATEIKKENKDDDILFRLDEFKKSATKLAAKLHRSNKESIEHFNDLTKKYSLSQHNSFPKANNLTQHNSLPQIEKLQDLREKATKLEEMINLEEQAHLNEKEGPLIKNLDIPTPNIEIINAVIEMLRNLF